MHSSTSNVSGIQRNLYGLTTYDFLKNPWHEGARQLNAVLSVIDEALKAAKLFHLIDNIKFPPPQRPMRAYRHHEQDLAKEREAHENFERENCENAEWEQTYGRNYRILRDMHVQRVPWTRQEEDRYWEADRRRPRTPKFKDPRYKTSSAERKEMADYPLLVKKEDEDSQLFIQTLCLYLSAERIQEYKIRLWDNPLNQDSIREKAVAAYLHLQDVRAAPSQDVEKAIDADFDDLPRIECFDDATHACAIATQLQHELSLIGKGERKKSDDFLIRAVLKKFDKHSQQLQTFIVKHSLGSGGLATKPVEIRTMRERYTQPADVSLATISMSWAQFVSEIQAMKTALSTLNTASIYSARTLGVNSAVHFVTSQHELDRQTRHDHRQDYLDDRERRNRGRSNSSQSDRRGRYGPPRNPDRSSRSRELSRERSSARKFQAGATPGRQPSTEQYPNWHTVSAAKAEPEAERRQFRHRAFSARFGPFSSLEDCPRYLDADSNPYRISDAGKSGYVHYEDGQSYNRN